jgi:isopenicillin N synthase-like dioxygenase
MTNEKVITLDYHDLNQKDVDLSSEIAQAFGNSTDCLGVCFVKNVPNLKEQRQLLLQAASHLAALSPIELQEITHKESLYNFGWSHGKEIMNGKPDFAKGSFYNNPVYDCPPCINLEFQKNHPEYGFPNIWPRKLPMLHDYFMNVFSS